MATSRIISKTIFRVILVSGLLSVINDVAPNDPVIHWANYLLWFWALGHLIDPFGRMVAWAFHHWLQRAAQRRCRKVAVAKATEPVPLSQWGLHD
jgi:hypothetical protein